MKNPIQLLSKSRVHSSSTPASSSSEAAGTASARPEKQSQEVLVYKTRADRRFPTFAQLRYMPQLFSGIEKMIVGLCMILFVASLGTLGVRGYYHSTQVVPKQGGTYTEGLVGSPQYINPILSPLSDVDSDLTELLFPGLFKHNDQQQLQPDLITNYVISDDQLTYTFFLRSDIKWHDGERLDADDVLFTIALIQDPLAQSPLQSSLKGVTATKIDDFSFSLKLEESFAPFLSSLTFGILPEHIWFSVPPQNIKLTGLNLQPVGAGPFKFDVLTKDKSGNIKSFQVVRNEEYYAQKPYIDTINFLFYPDVSMATQALKEKKIEGLAFLPKESKGDFQKNNSRIELHSLRIPQYTALFFNQKKTGVLRDKAVRQALAYAVNRDSIIQEVLGGQGEAIYTPILPGYIGHNPDVDKHAFDLEKSKQLLEDKGWKYPESKAQEGADFIPREKDGVKLEITVATVNLPEYQNTLANLQKTWKEIGVKVNVDTYSPEDIQSKVIKNRDYEALLFGEIIGSDPDPYAFWHSSQQEYPGLALAINRDKDVDNLLDSARKTTNEEDRRLKYLHFQNNLAEELPALFLYNPLYTYAIDKKVQGINSQQYITVPADRFSNVNTWYIKTKRERK